MAATSSSPRTVSLKLMIDPKSNRLLFAEAGKDFVDFLFYIMSLPVGTVVRLLGEQETAGSIGNIYRSIKKLNDSYMLSAPGKDMLLKPMLTNYLPNAAFLLPSMQSSTHTILYKCCIGSCLNVAIVPGSRCTNNGHNNCICHNLTFVNLTYNDPNLSGALGFVKGVVPYMILDDISVMPMSAKSIISLLNVFNVKDVSCLEEKVIDVGVNECVELVRASMQSKTVFSSVFLVKKESVMKSEAWNCSII